MKIEKNKLVFAGVLAVIVIFLVCYALTLTDSDEASQQLIQTEVPSLEVEQKEYDSKLDALDDLKEVKQQTAPSIYDEYMLDSLGFFDPNHPEQEKQRIVDSIYRANQTTYQARDYKEFGQAVSKDTSNRQEVPVINQQEMKVTSQELGLAHQLFFAAARSTSLKTTPILAASDTALHAVVDGDQVVKANSRIRLRLSSKSTINGVVFPKNTLVFGSVSFQPNRALINIENVNHKPIALEAYDLQDGLAGIYVENNFRAQASREVFDDVLQDINIPSLPQVGGISQLLRRDNRHVKVTVLNNYKLLLKAN
ncbi:putative protein DUF3714 [Leeuwenhoekiella aestuarii]|uniref:conjugative transposon protein TraM n=1 Tax=Leeuwenhoekiella aestuarii TaxID=2249426 RepID=UPI000FFE60AD|nr:conjugative transposon protein TraM [Leeuwenhoekiella aestuarii]RXG11247.1 putative protein DUF3714 [Leeuwenhoekiella aestuarii]